MTFSLEARYLYRAEAMGGNGRQGGGGRNFYWLGVTTLRVVGRLHVNQISLRWGIDFLFSPYYKLFFTFHTTFLTNSGIFWNFDNLQNWKTSTFWALNFKRFKNSKFLNLEALNLVIFVIRSFLKQKNFKIEVLQISTALKFFIFEIWALKIFERFKFNV